MKITAVIPTKNRLDDLRQAVQSVKCQLRRPDQLVVVDQSTTDHGLGMTSDILSDCPDILLSYIYDPEIAGLVAAKEASLSIATGDAICFLEDDIVLEPEYIREIESGFSANPDMLGCSGVITNPPNTSEFYLCVFDIFHRGIYRDHRPRIYAGITANDKVLIPSSELSGGVSAWRQEVFEKVKFDTRNGFHMIEDFEFSKRASHEFGARFYVNPNARLAHYAAPSNRGSLGSRHKRKTVEYITYFKKNSQVMFSSLALLWLIVGLIVDALGQAVRNKTVDPLTGLCQGLAEGIRKKLVSPST